MKKFSCALLVMYHRIK
ncbi:hypothetical protein BpHYR1_033211 [Brachionus plicatilis]|uniref:Uncharacterized protein n=1 Tax=Brachionus plicatilis TaxID=10195 RepID=A0A3M7ST24_BRAPC|nr:hypothetical protein BpHYR1_033211 [Brachionus plicatilis]